jgi:hypothetical protein
VRMSFSFNVDCSQTYFYDHATGALVAVYGECNGCGFGGPFNPCTAGPPGFPDDCNFLSKQSGCDAGTTFQCVGDGGWVD